MENLQFLGICGILQETFKLIHKGRRIFTQITLAFILPHSLSVFAHIQLSIFFAPKFHKLSDVVSSKSICYALFNFVIFIVSTVFLLLSTSAVAYTVASIHTARDVAFEHVIAVVPKLWRRLLPTFKCVLTYFFAFNLGAFFTLFLRILIAVFVNGPNAFADDDEDPADIGTLLFYYIVFYCVGLTKFWELSSVVSVLEDVCGSEEAMARSSALLKGNMRMAAVLMGLLCAPFAVVQILFCYLVAAVGVAGKGILGIVWVLSILVFVLVKLVVDTLLYFVCKSYHHESIDKLALSCHLQGCVPAC
ncbi:uncharacterized protein LOC111021152 [Momordica charantia]|uniref:Uncharacterized protein LOC111021152 n=1 Tax=Momordica charantia TaxID=3673 RepID=A0A6J1DHJ9_MOMCH|nr:uncharacterized protein LOC111021152 [Momordica charantia]